MNTFLSYINKNKNYWKKKHELKKVQYIIHGPENYTLFGVYSLTKKFNFIILKKIIISLQRLNSLKIFLFMPFVRLFQ